MKTLTKGVALLALLLAAPAIGLAQAAQQGGSGRGAEGNLQSGAAMDDAQKRSSGTSNTGTPAQPEPRTQSPRPPGTADNPARQRPEGNLGSGAAMTGSQRESTGAGTTGGASPPTASPQSPGAATPAR
jgi:hypothetical protein